MDRRANRGTDTAALPFQRLVHAKLLFAVALLILCGAALRIAMLAQDVRLHPDEALYATFARRISLHGDVLLTDTNLDKPPLSLIVTAVSFSSFGVTEFAARLPSLYASVLTLAVVYAIARRVYSGWRMPILAIALLALSPLDLAFAATAFLDPLLTLLILSAGLAALHDRWRWAGLAFILAIATKQTALVFLPLIVGLGMLRLARTDWQRRDYVIRLRMLVIPILVGGIVLALWSAARAAPIDFWTLGALNNSPGRFIRSNEIVPRLARWLDLLSNVIGFSPLLGLAVIPFVIRRGQQTGEANRNDIQATLTLAPSPAHTQEGGDLALKNRATDKHRTLDMPMRESAINYFVAAFVLAGLFGYWLIAFNTYDRYMHPLGPLILLLAAAGLARLPRVVWVIVMVCMLPFTLKAVRGDLTIGGDHGEHNGVVELAAAINQLPDGTQISHYWLDWELGFYLGDATKVRLVFQPSPEALITAACAGDGYYAVKAKDVAAWFTPGLLRMVEPTLKLNGNLRLYWLDCVF